MNKLIFVVDDEPDILKLVSLHLRKANFEAIGLTNAKELFDLLENRVPSLIILDLMLPDADGFDVCKQLKRDDRFSTIPIIMLTAKGEETDKIVGLELGADDYVTKPFSPKELVARVKAVLRRFNQSQETKIIKIGDKLVIDPQKYQVYVEGKEIKLTSTEFRLLYFLCRRKGWVFTREQILDYLWGNEKMVLDRTVDVHVRNLRKKLGSAGNIIKNVRGIGYKVDAS